MKKIMRQIKYMILVFVLGIGMIRLEAMEAGSLEALVEKHMAEQQAALAEKGVVSEEMLQRQAAEQEAWKAPKPKAPAIPTSKPKLKPPVTPKAAEQVMAEGEAGIKVEPTERPARPTNRPSQAEIQRYQQQQLEQQGAEEAQARVEAPQEEVAEPAQKPTSKRPVPAIREKTAHAIQVQKQADQFKRSLKELEAQMEKGEISNENYLAKRAQLHSEDAIARANGLKRNLPILQKELNAARIRLANAEPTADEIAIPGTEPEEVKNALQAVTNAENNILNNAGLESGARAGARGFEIQQTKFEALDLLNNPSLTDEVKAARKKIILQEEELALKKEAVRQAQIEEARLRAQVKQMEDFLDKMEKQKKATMARQLDPGVKKTLEEVFDNKNYGEKNKYGIKYQNDLLDSKKSALVDAEKALKDAQKELAKANKAASRAAKAAAKAAKEMPVQEVAIPAEEEGALVQEVVPEEAPKVEPAPEEEVKQPVTMHEARVQEGPEEVPVQEAAPEEQKSAQAIETQKQKSSPTLRQRWQRLKPAQKKAAGFIGAAGVGAATLVGVGIHEKESESN